MVESQESSEGKIRITFLNQGFKNHSRKPKFKCQDLSLLGYTVCHQREAATYSDQKIKGEEANNNKLNWNVDIVVRRRQFLEYI